MARIVSTEASGQAHFQLFAADWKSDVRWRLLSANNRELGRSYLAHPNAEACVLAIKEMVVVLDELTAQVRRKAGNLWQWMLVFDDAPVAVSGHAYDRQIRSQEAAGRFRSHARSARVGEAVMLTATRRWVRTQCGEPINISSAAIRELSIRPLKRP
jgi:hypothetical protein